MEIKSFFVNFISSLGNAIIRKPRLAGLILIFFIIFTATGWAFALYYHRIVELLSIPNDGMSETSAAVTPPIPSPQEQWQSITIKSGDSLYSIFKRMNWSMKDLMKVVAATKSQHQSFARLKPGQQIHYLLNAQQQLQKFVYSVDAKKDLVITRTDSGFNVAINPTQTFQATQQPATTQQNSLSQSQEAKPTTLPAPQALQQNYQKQLAQSITDQTQNAIKYGFATVNKSLYQAGRSADLSPKESRLLVHLFTESASMAKLVRRNDQLSVLTDKDNLLFVELKNQKKNKDIELIRFTDPKGNAEYYTANGTSLKPLILRAPLNYQRISSYFSAHRWQPLLHIVRPHYGVDYAAPIGTPIKAAGDGRLAFIGQEHGYGNTIEIKHADNYETLYAHISRFAKGLHRGSYVKQGQVIAYVGETGLATGAHLHFEIRLNNIPHNPLTIALPKATIPNAYRKQFFAERKELLAVLADNQQKTSPQFATTG